MELTPVQERTLDQVIRVEEFPLYRRELADDLRAELEERVGRELDALPEGQTLWLSKARLVDLHARCEGLFVGSLLGEGAFEYSAALARGQLLHRAVEIAVYRPDLVETELVALAIRQLRRDDPRFDTFAGLLTDDEAVDLEADAARQLVLFRASFPPPPRSWAPVVELSLRARLLDDRVVLSARPDLALGTPDPAEPMRGRRLLLELKTGADRPEHDEDARFYALVATLRFGVPPYRVATLNLDSGTWRPQNVTEDLLRSAVRRVADACRRAAALLSGAEPRLNAGPWCGWCPRAPGCPAAATREA